MLIALLLQVPDLDALGRAAAAARERFLGGFATWTASHTLDNGAVVEVHIARHGERRSVVVKVGAEDLGRLIVRDGLWHVVEAGAGRKHRPYEAAFVLPSWYLFMDAAEPVFLEDPEELRGLPFDGAAEGVGTWRQPLPEPSRRQILLAMGSSKNPDLLRQGRELLEKGVAFRVRLRDGLKVEVQNPRLRTSIRDFTLHEKPDPRAFDLPAVAWTDVSDDPTRGKLENLVLLAHSAAWQKGQKAGDMNLGLMDVETGRFRRVPFRGAALMPGGFSPDRRKVYGSGPTGDGLLGLFEIDLSTGENRRLGGNLAAQGVILSPAASPDGKTVAALHMASAENILESRVALVEVATGEARYLTESGLRTHLSWLPDGKSLLLLEQDGPLTKEVAVTWIARMDLEGRSTRLRRGRMPVPIGESILYEDGGTWWTCDREGRNEKAFGDGRRHHILPCPSPDGQRVLMLRRRANDGPEPVVIDVATGRERPVPITPGLWGQPAWR
jgi:hypothetical protein